MIIRNPETATPQGIEQFRVPFFLTKAVCDSFKKFLKLPDMPAV